MSNFLLKACISVLTPIIQDNVWKYFRESNFPIVYKLVKIICVLIGLLKLEMNNYQPISNPSFGSKTIEGVIYINLLDYLT